MKKKISIVIFTFTAVLAGRLFCGVYVHDEFLERNLFIKHRPIWKWKFYSPIGQSNTNIERL